MPPLPVIPDVYRCAFNWQNSTTGQTAVNVMHFLDSIGTGSVAALVAAIDANVTSAMLYPVNQETHANSVDVLPLDGTTASVTVPLTNWDGAGATGQFSPATTGVITLRTGVRGRSARGRVYLPFPSEGNLTNGSFDPASIALCTAAWTAFVTAMNGDDYPMVVASYLEGLAREVLSAEAHVVAGTQRRRQSRLA